MHLTVSHMILDIATPSVSSTGVLEDRRKIMVLLPHPCYVLIAYYQGSVLPHLRDCPSDNQC